MAKVFVQERSKFVSVANDTKVQVTFDPDMIESYRLIGYERRVMDNKDFEDDSSVPATAFFTSIAKCTIKKSLVSLNPQGRVNNYVSISNKISPRRLQSFTLFGIFRKIYNHRDGSHLVPPKVGHFFQLTKFPPYIFRIFPPSTRKYHRVYPKAGRRMSAMAAVSIRKPSWP